MLSEQVQDRDHGTCMFNGEQVNDHIEQEDHADDVIEDDGKNTLIHDSFNVRMDEDEFDTENDDDFDDVHDIHLLDKAYEPLYEGSKTNILSTVLLIMNLKVMNGI